MVPSPGTRISKTKIIGATSDGTIGFALPQHPSFFTEGFADFWRLIALSNATRD